MLGRDKTNNMAVDTSLPVQEPPSARTWLYADKLCREASNLYEDKNRRADVLGPTLDDLLNACIRPANIQSQGVLGLKE
jgi:hypothetical protein